MDIIICKDLSKCYNKRISGKGIIGNLFYFNKKKIKVIDKLSCSIKKDEKVLLVGPNGSGKTTFLKMVSGIVHPTSGTITIKGKPVSDTKREVGIFTNDLFLYRQITGWDNIDYIAGLYNLTDYEKRAKKLARSFLLQEEALYDYVSNYSTGMFAKLRLICCMLHDPEILLLDEAVEFLDIESEKALVDFIKNSDKTIIMVSHKDESIQKLAQREIKITI